MHIVSIYSRSLARAVAHVYSWLEACPPPTPRSLDDVAGTCAAGTGGQGLGGVGTGIAASKLAGGTNMCAAISYRHTGSQRFTVQTCMEDKSVQLYHNMPALDLPLDAFNMLRTISVVETAAARMLHVTCVQPELGRRARRGRQGRPRRRHRWRRRRRYNALRPG